MTKLEELEATLEAAGTACEAAYATRADAWDAAEVWAAWNARNDAWVAYKAELKKTQEENSDD
jgi:hypothetical protein